MNERIEKLAEQVGLWNDMEPTRRSGRYVGHMNVADVEKFAELIVEECADVILKWKVEPFPFDEDLAVRLIKDHFGVK